MNDERLRWALEQIEAHHPASPDWIAAWALGHIAPSLGKRLDKEYAATFKLKADR